MTTVAFAKYHGIGNDFVMIADPEDGFALTPDLVRKLCDRRFGVGGDGVIRVAPGTGAGEFFMDYYNSDGSIGEMCGNGIRCLAVFVRRAGLSSSSELKVETRAGPKVVWLLEDGAVRVDMGAPVFAPHDVPVVWPGDDALRAQIALDDRRLAAACLSMGNPHAVIFVDGVTDPAADGPRIERHPMFPNGTNVEFVRVESPGRIAMRVWERGAGETLACGTGACAAAVAARLLRATRPSVTVALPGGELEVSWEGSRDVEAPVFMTGPVAQSFEGSFELDVYA